MPSADDDAARLSALVALWWQAIEDLTTLLEEIPPAEWSTPTDLAGWDVHACAAHTAHLEAMVAGEAHDDVEIGEPAHVTGPMGRFTEQGVVARRHRSSDELINEIRESATTRHTALLADPPTDPAAPAHGVFGALGWTVERLLRNRPLDVWMHEQDVRRAVGRPGNLEGAAADHTTAYLAENLGYVLGKRVGAEPGTTLLAVIGDLAPVAFGIGDDRRGRPLADLPADPTVSLAMDRETFVLLAGGRRPVPAGAVRIEGEHDLGERVVSAMAVTP